MEKLHSEIILLNKNLQSALNEKLKQNQELERDNCRLKSQLHETNAQVEQYKSCVESKEELVQRIQKEHEERIQVMNQRLDGRESIEKSLSEVQCQLTASMEQIEKKNREIAQLTTARQHDVTRLKKVWYEFTVFPSSNSSLTNSMIVFR